MWVIYAHMFTVYVSKFEHRIKQRIESNKKLTGTQTRNSSNVWKLMKIASESHKIAANDDILKSSRKDLVVHSRPSTWSAGSVCWHPQKCCNQTTETNFWNEFSVFIEERILGSNDHFSINLFKPIFWLKVMWWHSLSISGTLSSAILWPLPTICWPLSTSFYCLRSMFIFNNPACCPII